MLSALPQRFVQLDRREFFRTIPGHPIDFVQFQDADHWTLGSVGTPSHASNSPTLLLTPLVSLTW